MRTVAFFNNKGGVGKTTFTYHLGYALEMIGKKVLFVDLDPQCNLTAHLCEDDVINNAWSRDGNSIYKAVEPIVTGAGDIKFVEPYRVNDRNIWIFIGDLLLSDFDGELSIAWTQILAGQERGFRVTSSIYRLIRHFASSEGIDYILVDLGPNLGALNRASLLGCDNFFIPMIPDLFSLRGSQNLGRVFSEWITNYADAKRRIGALSFDVPAGEPVFSGYILQQFNVYRSRKTKAYQNWGEQIPSYINTYVVTPLRDTNSNLVLSIPDYKFAEFKNYHSLVPMAQESLKPIFELTSQDGVIGSHYQYVNSCREEFSEIAKKFISMV